MTAEASPPLRVVLHEGDGSRDLAGARRYELLRALLESGCSVTTTGNGGDVAPPDSSDVLVLREAAGTPTADGEFGGLAPLPGGASQEVKVHLRDVGGTDASRVVEIVEGVRKETGTYRNEGWKPWFPVIDYDRCTNCMQCLSFCLFDVYGVDKESRITVQNPDKCKTNCPACSRVCPDVAILFPKYGSGPINGDEVDQKDIEREKMKVDISALLGGDIYSMLRERHVRAASRFSKERDESRALKERMRCLKKLQEDLDIPAEVLTSLPSREEIVSRAEAARQRTGSGSSGSSPPDS